MLLAVMSEHLKAIQESLPHDLQRPFDGVMVTVNDTITKGVNKALDQLLHDTKHISEHLFAQMDDNKDGRVTQEEFLKHYQLASNSIIQNDLMMDELKKSVMKCVRTELCKILDASKAPSSAS